MGNILKCLLAPVSSVNTSFVAGQRDIYAVRDLIVSQGGYLVMVKRLWKWGSAIISD
jgi:hypothetical protein